MKQLTVITTAATKLLILQGEPMQGITLTYMCTLDKSHACPYTYIMVSTSCCLHSLLCLLNVIQLTISVYDLYDE